MPKESLLQINIPMEGIPEAASQTLRTPRAAFQKRHSKHLFQEPSMPSNEHSKKDIPTIHSMHESSMPKNQRSRSGIPKMHSDNLFQERSMPANEHSKSGDDPFHESSMPKNQHSHRQEFQQQHSKEALDNKRKYNVLGPLVVATHSSVP